MAHKRSRGNYGALRIHADLRAAGVRTSRRCVARLMRAAGLAGYRRRVRITIADPTAAPAPNLVARDFTAPAPDRLWRSDITYVATREGWLYRAILLDAHSRRVVGWAMAEGCAPSWPWSPSRWPPTPAARRPGYFTIPIAAVSTPRRPTKRRSRVLAASAR